MNANKNRVVIIQPFADFPSEQSKQVLAAIQKILPKAILQGPLVLPASAFYSPRNRYRADSLIAFLRQRVHGDTVVIGLTAKDISTTRGSIADWGIMGLAYTPGESCIVSTFRLHRQNTRSQLYKVVLHELGHTQGLPHCTNETCFMRDAEGGNPTDKERDFCPSCKSYLRSMGWNLE